MKRTQRKWLSVLLPAILLAAAAAIYWANIKQSEQSSSPQDEPVTVARGSDSPSSSEPPQTTREESSPRPAPEATDLYKEALDLYSNDPTAIIQARTKLSEAIFTGKLTPAQEAQACELAWQLAGKTLFSSDTYDRDPYTDLYRVQNGDSLQSIERKLALHVPAQLLQQINGGIEPGKLQVGRSIKVIKGPFHALVINSRFTMDLYLQATPDSAKLFVKRIRVGLGRDGRTPVGLWHVRLGRPGTPPTATSPAQPPVSGKMRNARYDPPPNSEIRQSIEPGQPGYPFGPKGLWIPLEGMDDKTRGFFNYGIHSTDDSESIGKESSLGCVRLGDDDIELVYKLLYEHWSTVETRP